MQWGFLTVQHILSLILGALLLLGLYRLLLHISDRAQTALLGVLSFSGILAIVYNLIKGPALQALPLQLCSLTAMLLPVLVFTKSSFIGNLLLFWGLGAAGALVINVSTADAMLFDTRFLLYYFPHLMEFGIPVLMLKRKHFRREPSHMGRILVVTVAAYSLAHLVNVILTAQGIPANYMFSMGPTNAAAQLLWSLLPLRYWYLFLLLPVVLLYGAVLYKVSVRQLLRYATASRARG